MDLSAVRLSPCRFLVCVAAIIVFAPHLAAQQMEKLTHFADSPESWQQRAETIRATILAGAHLAPLPERTPLHPIFANRRDRGWYSVEDIAFESVPGFYVFGNLYRPLGVRAKARCPLSSLRTATSGKRVGMLVPVPKISFCVPRLRRWAPSFSLTTWSATAIQRNFRTTRETYSRFNSGIAFELSISLSPSLKLTPRESALRVRQAEPRRLFFSPRWIRGSRRVCRSSWFRLAIPGTSDARTA